MLFCVRNSIHSHLSINSPQSGDGNFDIYSFPFHNIVPNFRSTLPNLGMETIANASAPVMTDCCAFRSTLPNLGMETPRTGCNCLFQTSHILSINSPQSGDGNRQWQCLHLKSPHRLAFDQLSPIWGWKPTISCPCSWETIIRSLSFDQLSPIWGWKPLFVIILIKLMVNKTFDQLSPIWGWKQLNLHMINKWIVRSPFDQLSPIWGWKPLYPGLSRAGLIFDLSINSPQSGDGNY